MFLSDRVVTHLREVASWPDLPDGRYRILQPIGRGGMGTVYLARDDRLERDVAVKVSNAPAASSDLDIRLRREAIVLATLEHPGIAAVYDAGVLGDGRLFYVMQLVRGETLEQHARSLTTESARLAIVERVIEPLAFAHARGIVHRDIKPSNIMVGPFGEVLVLDWGTAKIMDDARAPSPPIIHPPSPMIHPPSPMIHPPSPMIHLPSPISHDNEARVATETGTLMGTPGFMPPEQAEGRVADITPASDVYALGALLRWLIGDASSSKRLTAIAAKCLAARPEDRYANAGEIAADLARYRAGQSVIAAPDTVWDRIERWFLTYRTFILLVAAYLLMRAVLAWWLPK